jgi:hypothetical protein
MGLSGALLAFAEIAAVEPGALRDVQPDRLVGRLLATVDALCALPPRGWQTGMAHGPPGAIIALESCRASGWCRITTRRRQRWIDALSRSAMAGMDGCLYWPAIAGEQDLALQSWCAGTPGIALALLQCFRLTSEPAYLEFARGALEGMKVLSSGAQARGRSSRSNCSKEIRASRSSRIAKARRDLLEEHVLCDEFYGSDDERSEAAFRCRLAGRQASGVARPCRCRDHGDLHPARGHARGERSPSTPQWPRNGHARN